MTDFTTDILGQIHSKVECDVIWEFDWVDIPEPIQNFIVSRADNTYLLRE